MIDFIFTLDYEIYGNGVGSLRDLVLDPTQRIAEIFRDFGAPFVIFAEAVELAKIDEAQSDPGSAAVREQLRELRAAGHEIALHLHPWWANARYESGRWQLDWNERNLGTLPPERLEAIVAAGIDYLRSALGDPDFTPVAFRAGQWLFQPSAGVTQVLVEHDVRLDSSVFKGGRMRGLGLDYRPAAANDAFWRFADDVNVPDSDGQLWEIPIHTEMVPFWRMLRPKRLQLQHKTRNASQGSPLPRDWRDFVRFRYPRKLDFCRMSFEEMRQAAEGSLANPCNGCHNIVVAIGHSKDFLESNDIRRFLAFLRERALNVTTFARMLQETPLVFC